LPGKTCLRDELLCVDLDVTHSLTPTYCSDRWADDCSNHVTLLVCSYQPVSCVMLCLGEKPYICTSEGCGKRFTEYSSLYKHHVVHTHTKPYECADCGKTYRQTSTLAMHRRMAHCDVSNDPTTAVSSTFFLTAGDFMLSVFMSAILHLGSKTCC